MRTLGQIIWLFVLLFCIVESIGIIVETCTATGSLATGKLNPVAQARSAALGGALFVLAIVLLRKLMQSWLGRAAPIDGQKTPSPGAWGRFLHRGPG
jgi:hypothetical protein